MSKTITKKEINSGLHQAENEFNEIVGACFLFIKANTTCTDLEIISGLQISLAQVIEEIKERVGKN